MLCTDNRGSYWKITDYLHVVEYLIGCHYIYFTSEKSGIVELMQWVGEMGGINIFHDAKICIVNA
jgi:hypothetical protein